MFKTYFRLLGFARPIEKFAIPYLLFAALNAMFNALQYALIIPLLNSLFGTDGGGIKKVTEMPPLRVSMSYMEDLINYTLFRIFGENYDLMNVLTLVAMMMVVVVFLNNFFNYMARLVIEKMRVHTLRQIRNKVFDNVIGMEMGFFANERKGDVISKLTNDVQTVQFCVTNTLQVVIREPLMFFPMLAMLIAMSWELSIFAAIFLPTVGLLIGALLKTLRKPATQAQEAMGVMVSDLDESFSGLKIIKAYNATDYIKDKYHKVNDLLCRLTLKIARRQAMAGPMSEFLGITTVAIILVYGGNLVINGNMNAATFLAFVALFSQIIRPARTFMDAFSTVNQGLAAGDRVLALYEARPGITDKPNAKELKDFSQGIEFKDVRFSYVEGREVIKGISFKVKKGQTVALVGPSGGGKSTISDLIPRFYDVASGAILVDGVDLKDYSMESLRSHIGVVAQETILFNDTIEENLRLGKRDATQEEIIRAAKVANAHNFIMDTDDGYQHNIGDRGGKLSGGQRQRLSIARAVLKNPDILILDEATSALDTESERLVQDALNNLLQGRTSIVIAHRLSTIRHADRIYVIESGHVAEQGSHEELIQKGGIYAKLIEMQQLS